VDDDNDTYRKKGAEMADETAMAQEFDVKLKQEVLEGMVGLVNITKKIRWMAHVTLQKGSTCMIYK